MEWLAGLIPLMILVVGFIIVTRSDESVIKHDNMLTRNMTVARDTAQIHNPHQFEEIESLYNKYLIKLRKTRNKKEMNRICDLFREELIKLVDNKEHL